MIEMELTAALFCYFRFKRQFSHIATEVGGNNADIILLKGKELVEIEVKKSIADFRNDFRNKLEKHQKYSHNPKELVVSGYRQRESKKWIPHKMYYAVPESLQDKALELLNDTYKKYGEKYGLIVMSDANIQLANRISIVKKATHIHKNDIDLDKIKLELSKRMTSMLANMFVAQAYQQNMFRVIDQHIMFKEEDLNKSEEL